jgi:adenine phosphoribosyltransferase
VPSPLASQQNLARISALIRDFPDFPKPGVVFKDITPLLADPVGLQAAVVELIKLAPPGIDVVVAMEARGFILGAPVALALGAGFVPIRKPGKLPGPTVAQTFALEYGTDTLAVHADAVLPGARVLVIDDVLATGGTVSASAGLIRQLEAELVQVAVLLELSFLGARSRLTEQGIDRVSAVLTVGEESTTGSDRP